MRIGYFGDGLWAHLALQKILNNDEMEVVFIVPRFHKPDPVLKKEAEKYRIPFIPYPDVNGIEFLERIKMYDADILVSMSFDQILKKSIIGFSPKGFINCHAGALPFYRGRNVLNWVLINGEKSFGVTVHYVDEGIDTGDIIIQKYVDIHPEDNYSTLLTKASLVCADLLEEALILIRLGNEKRIKQDSIHRVGFYCGRRVDGDEWIEWGWNSERIHNFIRGITNPGPCARTVLHKKNIAIIESEMINDAPSYIGTPGEVVGRETGGIIVKTGDSTIKIKKVATVNPDGKLINEKTPFFKIGSRFKCENDFRG